MIASATTAGVCSQDLSVFELDHHGQTTIVRLEVLFGAMDTTTVLTDLTKITVPTQ